MTKSMSDDDEVQRLNAFCVGKTLRRVRYDDDGDSVLTLEFADGTAALISTLGAFVDRLETKYIYR